MARQKSDNKEISGNQEMNIESFAKIRRAVSGEKLQDTRSKAGPD